MSREVVTHAYGGSGLFHYTQGALRHANQQIMAAAPIAPITGMLKKTFFVHVTAALVGGYTAGSVFWYGFHIPEIQKRAYQWTNQAMPTTPSSRAKRAPSNLVGELTIHQHSSCHRRSISRERTYRSACSASRPPCSRTMSWNIARTCSGMRPDELSAADAPAQIHDATPRSNRIPDLGTGFLQFVLDVDLVLLLTARSHVQVDGTCRGCRVRSSAFAGSVGSRSLHCGVSIVCLLYTSPSPRD